MGVIIRKYQIIFNENYIAKLDFLGNVTMYFNPDVIVNEKSDSTVLSGSVEKLVLLNYITFLSLFSFLIYIFCVLFYFFLFLPLVFVVLVHFFHISPSVL